MHATMRDMKDSPGDDAAGLDLQGQPSVAVIGSFKTKERYDAVLTSIEAFRREGWIITSPMGSAVIASDIDFVRFETDDPTMDDQEVQSRTLARIMSANLTYVTAPGGYVGRTTCYEIGRLVQANRPVFFSEPPIDLPIWVAPMFVAPAHVVAQGFKGRRPPTLFASGKNVVSGIERQLIDG